jgi:hypothetical protein
MHEATQMTDSIALNKASYGYLMNVLNEALCGFKVDYENTLGATQEDVKKLFQRLDVLSDNNVLETQGLSVADAQLLLRCSNLCLNEIDADEFDTRLGGSPEGARQLNQLLLQRIGTDSMSKESSHLEQVTPLSGVAFRRLWGSQHPEEHADNAAA